MLLGGIKPVEEDIYRVFWAVKAAILGVKTTHIGELQKSVLNKLASIIQSSFYSSVYVSPGTLMGHRTLCQGFSVMALESFDHCMSKPMKKNNAFTFM